MEAIAQTVFNPMILILLQRMTEIITTVGEITVAEIKDLLGIKRLQASKNMRNLGIMNPPQIIIGKVVASMIPIITV